MHLSADAVSPVPRLQPEPARPGHGGPPGNELRQRHSVQRTVAVAGRGVPHRDREQRERLVRTHTAGPDAARSGRVAAQRPFAAAVRHTGHGVQQDDGRVVDMRTDQTPGLVRRQLSQQVLSAGRQSRIHVPGHVPDQHSQVVARRQNGYPADGRGQQGRRVVLALWPEQGRHAFHHQR